MEHQIQEAGQQAMRTALKQTIRQKRRSRSAAHSVGRPAIDWKEGTTRRVVSTVFGRVEVARRFLCQNCLHRWCPANRWFAGLHGGVISKPLQEAAMLAGCSWSYRVAAEVLRKLSGASISAEEIRLVTECTRKPTRHPPASGMIERAVSLVINRRMKKRGMRWKRSNETAIVALRTDLLNEDWILPQPLRFFS